MTIAELKETIADLPDEMDVIIELWHSECSWKDTATTDIGIYEDITPKDKYFYLIAKIDDK